MASWLAMTGATDGRIRVLWLTKGLGPGGAERLLVSFASLADHSRFELRAAYLLPWKDHLVADLEDLGVATTCLAQHVPWDPRWVWRLRTLARRERIDVVHVHSPMASALARLVLRTLRPRPLVVGTEHSEWGSYHPLTRLAIRLTHGLEDATLCVSEQVRASMPRRLGAKCEVVVNGVDVTGIAARRHERDRARAELGFAPGDVVVATVANLRSQKDYPTMLAAARELLDRGVPVRFVSVGQGPLEEELATLRDRLGLGDRFRFLGYQHDPVRVLVAADIFALSSRFEGLPIALLEAMAAGLPVAATNVGGIPAAVAEGDQGFLVAPGDPAALASAIAKLTDPDLRRRCAEAASARARDFSMERAVARQQLLYARLGAKEANEAPLVLHVVPEDLARGAQVHARELRRLLDGPGVRHRLVLLFGQERSVTGADVVLGAPSNLGRRVGFSASAYLRLLRCVRASRPVVVVAHGGESLKYAGLVPGRHRIVYHRIGSPPPRTRALSRLAYRALARRVDRLVGVGRDITEHARRELQVPSARTSVIHNGRDPEAFRPGPPRPDGQARLLFVGHLGASKRPDAFAELARALEGRNVTATVVGDGPLLGELRARYPEVSFLGRRPDVADIMRWHDILVFPGEGPEGLPGVLIEAALSGLATVATAVPGSDEVIEHGVTGVIVPVGDDEALVSAVSELVADPERRARMGCAAGRRAEERFSITRCAEAWRDLLADLLT
jgi:glycosyltransferase involved in cell wall biosynthesis